MLKKIWLPAVLIFSLIISCLVLTLVAVVYDRQSGRLPFKTLEKTSSSNGLWEAILTSDQPKILIFSKPEELDALNPSLTVKARVKLREIDFKTHFVVLYYPGNQMDLIEFGVQRLYRQGRRIIIEAKPGELSVLQSATILYHYHLLAVEKPEDWSGQVTFELYFDRTKPPLVMTSYHFSSGREQSPFQSPLPPAR